MTFFESAHGFVTTGDMYDIGNMYVTKQKEGPAGLQVLDGECAHGAFYNSAERFPPPKCHPRTRIAVRDTIHGWTGQKEIPMMWLHGPAGAGKSSIAQTFVESCNDSGLLAASFFFSRTAESRNTAKHLAATLAHQIVTNIPDLVPFVERAVERNPRIFTAAFGAQVDALIINPIIQFHQSFIGPRSNWPHIIVIDGLDECAGPDIQKNILQVFGAAVRNHHSFPFLCLVLSRLEPQIQGIFRNFLQDMTRTIVLDDSYHPDKDIFHFLSDKFKAIHEEHCCDTMATISAPWPSRNIINTLVNKASGQFIYASTVIKFIEDPREPPHKRLDKVLGISTLEEGSPFAELDNLYKEILGLVSDIPLTLRILGAAIALKRSESTIRNYCHPPVSVVLRLDPQDLHHVCRDIQSIVRLESAELDDGLYHGQLNVSFLHASLSDFLCEKSRSGPFFIDLCSAYSDLLLFCLHSIPCIMSRSLSPEERCELEQFVSFEYCPELRLTELDAFKIYTEKDLDLTRIKELSPSSHIHDLFSPSDESLFSSSHSVIHDEAIHDHSGYKGDNQLAVLSRKSYDVIHCTLSVLRLDDGRGDLLSAACRGGIERLLDIISCRYYVEYSGFGFVYYFESQDVLLLFDWSQRIKSLDSRNAFTDWLSPLLFKLIENLPGMFESEHPEKYQNYTPGRGHFRKPGPFLHPGSSFALAVSPLWSLSMNGDSHARFASHLVVQISQEDESPFYLARLCFHLARSSSSHELLLSIILALKYNLSDASLNNPSNLHPFVKYVLKRWLKEHAPDLAMSDSQIQSNMRSIFRDPSLMFKSPPLPSFETLSNGSPHQPKQDNNLVHQPHQRPTFRQIIQLIIQYFVADLFVRGSVLVMMCFWLFKAIQG